MISLIIPVYFANEEISRMTTDCVASIGPVDELILQIDDKGEGYTKTANKGLEKATGDILVVGNNDLLFHKGWLEELLLPLESGYDLSSIWTSDQKVQVEDRVEDGGKFGSLFAMKRELYEKVGGFDEQFNGYFADTDYRNRVLNAGFKIGKNLSAVIEHKAKATYGLVDPEDLEYQKAKILFERKWGYGE